jgi:hypothetical protein
MLDSIRTAAAVCLALMALPAVAQDRPPGLQPLPEAPADGNGADAVAPPRVIHYEETRINGIAFQPMVTPTTGRPYYLIDNRGDANQTWTRRGSLDSDLRVPQWSAGSF